MASQLADNSHFRKLLELKHRIEFLRNDVDPDILIGAIERELSMFVEFEVSWSLHHKTWQYYITDHRSNKSLESSINKLDALYLTLNKFK